MAISGQVRLCASGWGMGAILLVTIPAAAQEKRSFEVHVSGAAIYDSNAAGASKARAAARGLVQEEMEFRPDRKSTRLNSSHYCASRMPSSACKKKKTKH